MKNQSIAVSYVQVQDPMLPSSSEMADIIEETTVLLRQFTTAEPYLDDLETEAELRQKAWQCCRSSPAKKEVSILCRV